MRFLFSVFLCLITVAHTAVSFDVLRGSELLFGSGAAMAATGGAGSAVARDADAFYWNPAGMASAEQWYVRVNGNPGVGCNDATLLLPGRRVSFLPDSLALAAGYVTRLRFRGDSGDAPWNGFALHIMDISMLDIGDDFRGAVDSRTQEFRVGAAWAFSSIPLRAGLELCYLH